MQEVGRCGICDGCTQAEEQARLRAAQEAARETERLKAEETSHLCTAESIHPACPLKKSNHEPLAWSIESTDVLDQSNSPFFTLLPREIRDMIYNYALTDTTSYPVDRARPENPNPFARFDRVSGYSQSRAGIDLYASDIASPLLYTCKAIYLETYATPLRINPYITGELSVQRQKRNLSTWQLAQIRSLDITLPQHGLENGALRNYLNEYWNATSRYQGRYIVPLRAIRPSDRKRCENLEYANNNNSILVPVVGGGGLIKKKKRKDFNRLVDVLDSTSIIPQDSIYPCARTLKVALAQPIRHITLRLTHSDWWTWGNPPTTTTTDDNSTTRHLHLDPTFGSHPDGRPSNTNMRLRASERLRNRHPRLDPQSWGSHIKRALPGLETLELVLETWKVKEEQLECVVQCARTWRFCEEEGDGKEEKWALVWDGEVVEKRWSRGLRGLRLPKDASWADRCNDFEVRVVRYVKKVV